MADARITYDRQELRGITKAFKAMDAEALDQAKAASAEIAEMLKDKIIQKAQTRKRYCNPRYNVDRYECCTKNSRLWVSKIRRSYLY